MEELLALGAVLDERPKQLQGQSVAMWLAGELLRVRDRQGREQPLLANPMQQQYEARRGRRNLVLKARQMGMTTWAAGRFFLKTICARGVLTVQVAHTREAAESLFRMVQRFWEQLPEDLQRGALRRGRANLGQMTFPELDSEFRVVSAAEHGVGRGLTIQNLHGSELSRWPGDAAETLAGLQAALAPTAEVVLESTANGAYGCFYEQWQLAAQDEQVVRHFFPWWLEPQYVAAAVQTELRDEERTLVERHGLSLEQIGFRRGLEATYRGQRAQEFAEDPESCFRATGACCFDVPVLERRLVEAPEPVERRSGGALLVWLPTVPGKQYVVAVDTAGGGSEGDFAVAQVVELASGVQCAELQQRLSPLELARAVAGLAREYNHALVAVERNNHGAAVLAYLDSVQRYTHVYASQGVAGWLTTAGNKPAMISRLGALLVEAPWLLQSRRLLRECRTYVSWPNGRTGAASGAHDDCVMAMAVAQAVRQELLGR
ncbi:MAG: terminase [Acidobacteriota bacterium]|nr:terminase [Acidobacteriota bacterium]